MSYRARFIPTGKYYNEKIYPKLSIGRLMGWIKTSRAGYFNKEWAKEENWEIVKWPIPDGYSFDCAAVNGGDHTDYCTIIHNSSNIELFYTGDNDGSGFTLEEGKKYRVTIKELE